MKPMPASLTQRPTPSGARSILTPSEASTSAEPERDASARLPCFATGTPLPATIKAAQVETLTDPEPSPPVPTTSMASAGACTFSILPRIAATAPVISSTVSPRTRSAIKSPPICEGVASPDIMASKAEAASSRDSVAPVATLPIIDFRSSIAPTFKLLSAHDLIGKTVPAFPDHAQLLIGARRLRERGLVDAGADHRFDLGHILRDLLVGQAALQRFLQLLDLVGSQVGRRHGDVGDLENGPFAARAALSDAILRRAECRRDGAGGHARNRRLAFEVFRALDLGADSGGLIGKVAALFELLDHLGGLGAKSARNLVLAPLGFDLVAHLIERTLTRRRDADHVVPDVAAIELDRVVVDADVAVESLRDHIEPAWDAGDGLAVGHAAGTVYGVDRHG